MGSLRFSGPTARVLIGVPLGWAVLLLFHPLGSGQLYGEVRDEVTRWQVVHVGTLFLIGLMGLAVYLLVRDLPGTAARVSRWAAAVFVLFYGAWEAVAGLTVGALVHTRTAFPPLSARSDRTRSRASTTTRSWATSASSGASVRWLRSPR